MEAPVIYQPSGGGRHVVAGRYVQLGANEVGFQVDAYDKQLPLVLDPILAYSTTIGWSYYGEIAWTYLFGKNRAGR